MAKRFDNPYIWSMWKNKIKNKKIVVNQNKHIFVYCKITIFLFKVSICNYNSVWKQFLIYYKIK